jgi:hypothetical protein
LSPLAAGSPLAVELTATLAPDGRTIHGVARVTGPGWVWADPVAALPDPPSDLHAARTFPGEWDRGAVEVDAAGDGWRFTTVLPERFGAVGATGRGTFANGGWYPQPLVDGGLPEVAWTVSLTLPPGTVGALGGAAGEGTLRFAGVADRVPLAVVRGEEVGWLAPGVALVSPRVPGRRWLREVAAALPEGAAGVVARAPLRRRLTADGPGLVYVSDRAFRVTPGLEPAHRRGVARGLAAGLSGLGDDFDRDFVGAAATRDEPGVQRLLGVFRWVPQVNWVLTSQRIPFWAEATGQVWPADPVADDLSELFDPHWPGPAAVEWVAGHHGEAAVAAVADALSAGEPSPVDVGLLRRPPPVEDLQLAVDGAAVTVTRPAPPGSPELAAIVRVDGVDRALSLPPGPTTLFLPEPPRRVALDPDRLLPPSSRAGDSWPPRWDVTLAGWVDGVNLSRGQVWLGGQGTLRRWYDTHDLFLGSVYNSPSDLVGVRAGYLRKEGPLLDGISRPWRLRLDVGSALLNPAFSPTDGLAATVDTAVSVAWDDRVDLDFPRRGQRVGVGVGGGVIPGSTEAWTSANANAAWVGSPHPRVAFAGRAVASVARSSAPHRLLVLGGDSGIRSVPALPACPEEGAAPEPCLPVGTGRLTGVLELRTAPIRNASVPGFLAWGSELQLTLGLEGLLARVDGGPVSATGVTLTALGLADLLGVETTELGLTAAFRTSSSGLPLPADAPPELYLRFSQTF